MAPREMELQGKTAVITGASRGIGRAIALRLAKAGANIVVLAKTKEPHPTLQGTIYTVAREIAELGGNALPLQVDVREEQQLEDSLERAFNHFGAIDIVVNNAAAISLTTTPETTAKRWDLMVGVNMRATFLCAKYAIPYLLHAANPHILNISPPLNMDSKWFKEHLAYTISKYGMSMCTLGLAEELRSKGIAVNSLWPATPIATDAIAVHFPREIYASSRKPEIVAEAAYQILIQEAKNYSGKFLIDEQVLKEAGIKEFSPYSFKPNTKLFKDIFLEKS